MQLKSKVAIVTGAARGIGKGIALELAAEGVNLALVDLPAAGDSSLSYQLSDESLLMRTADEVEALGVKVTPVLADVTKAADTRRMVAETVASLGGVDILVNNAGVIIINTVMETTEAQWDRTMDVNVKGILLCCQATIPELINRDEGRIVNIASIAGKTGSAGFAAYSASKFAVIGFTQSLAKEVGPKNITVNAVCPGFLRTAMFTDVINKQLAKDWNVEHTEVFERFVGQNTYLRREQTTADIGECVVYLCKSDNVTGESINVAGGAEVH